MEGVAIGHNFFKGNPLRITGQFWLKLAQWFQRRNDELFNIYYGIFL
jgi:hypothetical protein